MSKLKLLRTEKKLSQRELAEKSGVSLRTLQHYEIGDRDINGARLEVLRKLSDVLEIKFYELLDDDLQYFLSYDYPFYKIDFKFTIFLILSV